MRAIVAGRHPAEIETFRPVEDPDDEEVREAIDVVQSVRKLREDLEHAFRLVPGAEAFRDLFGVGVRVPDESDWPWLEHHSVLRIESFVPLSIDDVYTATVPLPLIT